MINDSIARGKILVYGKMAQHGPVEGFLEMLGEAVRLKQSVSQQSDIVAACLGMSMQQYYGELFHHGADEIFCIDDPHLKHYQPRLFANGLHAIIQATNPDIVLAGASIECTEGAASVAARLQTGLAAHCVSLRIEQGKFIQVVPAFAGKILGDIHCPHSRPQMATLKEGMFSKVEADPTRSGPVTELLFSSLPVDDSVHVVSSMPTLDNGVPSLAQAAFVVAGGLGVGGAAQWLKLEQFAKTVGAAIGCTRPVLDRQWITRGQSMIGTSGVVVKPRLYLGVGISGAAHHMCGMGDALVSIAINSDPNAQIFSQVDYGVCEDWQRIIPMLEQKLRSRKES